MAAEADVPVSPIKTSTGSSDSQNRHPSISKSPEDETSAIDASLASRRQRGSLRNIFTGRTIKAKIRANNAQPDGRGSDAEEEQDESALRAMVEEGERMKAEMPKAVEVLRNGRRVVDVDDQVFENARQEFVWDGGVSLYTCR